MPFFNFLFLENFTQVFLLHLLSPSYPFPATSTYVYLSQGLVLTMFLSHSSTLCLKQILLLNQKLPRLAGQHPEICLFSIPPHPQALMLQLDATLPNFHMNAGDPTLGPHACTASIIPPPRTVSPVLCEFSMCLIFHHRNLLGS